MFATNSGPTQQNPEQDPVKIYELAQAVCYNIKERNKNTQETSLRLYKVAFKGFHAAKKFEQSIDCLVQLLQLNDTQIDYGVNAQQIEVSFTGAENSYAIPLEGIEVIPKIILWASVIKFETNQTPTPEILALAYAELAKLNILRYEQAATKEKNPYFCMIINEFTGYLAQQKNASLTDASGATLLGELMSLLTPENRILFNNDVADYYNPLRTQCSHNLTASTLFKLIQNWFAQQEEEAVTSAEKNSLPFATTTTVSANPSSSPCLAP